MADVTHDEDAWHARFQESRITIQPPSVRSFSLAYQMRARKDESWCVAFNDPGKPVCVWGCSDHDKQRICRDSVYFVSRGTTDGNGFEMVVAMSLYHGGIEFDL